MASGCNVMVADRKSCLGNLIESGLVLSEESKSNTCFTVLKDCSRLLTGDEGGRVFFWCLKEFYCVKWFKADNAKVIGIHEVSASKQFITIFDFNVIKAWGTEDCLLKVSIRLSFVPVCSKISGNEGAFLVLNKFAKFSLYSSENLLFVCENVVFGNNLFNTFDFCVEKDLIIVAKPDKTTLHYTLYSSEMLYENNHESQVVSVCILSKSDLYVTGEISGQVTIFEITNYRKVKSLLINLFHTIKILDLPEINQLIFASGNKTISRIEKSEYSTLKKIDNFKYHLHSLYNN